MKKLMSIAVFVVAFMAFSQSVQAAPIQYWTPMFCDPNGSPSAVITGRVRNIAGQPLYYQPVNLTDGTNGSICQTAYTTIGGYFHFAPTYIPQAYGLGVLQTKQCQRGYATSFTLTADRFFDIVIDCDNLNFP